MNGELIEKTGFVSDIIFSNEDNGYTICEITDENKETLVCVGYMPFISYGDKIKATGKMIVHPDYGDQFRVELYESERPETTEAIRLYLASGIIKGIREATAEKIVAKFGTDTLSVIENEPHRLAQIKGISIAKANEIANSYIEQKNVKDIVMFLQKYGITPNFAIKAFNVLGINAITRIKENPYVLCDDIDGISFKTADSIAGNMGYEQNSIPRLKSGIRYILSFYSQSQGHTCMSEAEVVDAAVRMLCVSQVEIENALVSLISEHNIAKNEIDGTDMLYLPYFDNAEKYTATKLSLLALSDYKKENKHIDTEIETVEAQSGISLAPEQKTAVKNALMHGVCVITGGPGTGKTTTINTIIKICQMHRLSVTLAAPTGRAAKRMQELCRLEAKTIHRMLEVEFKGKRQVQEFARNENNPIDADVVIIDETSMLDIMLMSSLLRAIRPTTRLVLVGDADQLPSVGAGNVLNDIIASETIPVVRLKTVFRQAEESMIVVNAHRINNGEVPLLNEKGSDFYFVNNPNANDVPAIVADLVARRLPNAYNKDSMTDIQVITPMRKTATGSANLNAYLQQAINPPTRLKTEKAFGQRIFREGDKVMQIKNNYDLPYEKLDSDGYGGLGIFNGDIGIIKSIDLKFSYMEIVFDDEKLVEYPFNMVDELELAYAMTVHKSQGNEFDIVVIPVVNGPKMLMTRNLLYTAVTRAKELVVICGNRESIRFMVENNFETKRYSGLKQRLEFVDDTPTPNW